MRTTVLWTATTTCLAVLACATLAVHLGAPVPTMGEITRAVAATAIGLVAASAGTALALSCAPVRAPRVGTIEWDMRCVCATVSCAWMAHAPESTEIAGWLSAAWTGCAAAAVAAGVTGWTWIRCTRASATTKHGAFALLWSDARLRPSARMIREEILRGADTRGAGQLSTSQHARERERYTKWAAGRPSDERWRAQMAPALKGASPAHPQWRSTRGRRVRLYAIAEHAHAVLAREYAEHAGLARSEAQEVMARNASATRAVVRAAGEQWKANERRRARNERRTSAVCAAGTLVLAAGVAATHPVQAAIMTIAAGASTVAQWSPKGTST